MYKSKKKLCRSDIPLTFRLALNHLQFDCQEKCVTGIMEVFVDNFYAYDFAGHLVEDDEDEGDRL